MDTSLTILRVTSPDELIRLGALSRSVGGLLAQGRRNFAFIIHHDGDLDSEQIRGLDATDCDIRRAGGSLSLVIIRDDLRFLFRVLRLDERFHITHRVEGISPFHGPCS